MNGDIRTSEIEPSDKEDKKCAPHNVFDAGSCIETGILVEMAKAYNKENSDNPIILNGTLETLNPRKYKKYLLKQMKDKTDGTCTTQRCWTEQSFLKHMSDNIKEKLERYTFRPDGPNGKFEWLNTVNINEVMKQYELKYPNFKFLGAVPMDFDDLPQLGIKNLNFNELKNNGKTKLGMVMNLDEHWKSGSHWVGLYSDLNAGKVYYFDSYGIPPEPRVRKFMRRLYHYFGKQDGGSSKGEADFNKIRHQYEDSECGVYSINFILRMLRGDTFEEVCESKTPDRKINKCRKIYFKKTDNNS
uniref:Ubiquitin-like protease family profile domain-containing protein n=1 Tax=viral metagenome TaxID=1070528 RepID=A0A6C0EBF2_9ZZZZ